VQLRGVGGGRQAHPAPRVALAATGAMQFTGCLLVRAGGALDG
jgi:hypothetical protein